jgi:hypothetical protein
VLVDARSAENRDTLVIVHLSSLDSFTWQCGKRAAAHLAEAVDDWDESISRLGSLLRKLGVGRLALGGLEAPPNEDMGCVNEVKRQLQAQGFACRVDPSLCEWYRDGAAGGE